MSGSKAFGPTQDFPQKSPSGGKSILGFDPSMPARFIDLLDTIPGYIGHGGKLLMVKTTEDGITVTTLNVDIESDITALSNAINVINGIITTNPIAFGLPINMNQLEILGLRLEQLAVDPVTPLDGRVWYNTTSHTPKVRINGVTIPFFSAADIATLAATKITADNAAAAIVTINSKIDNISSSNILSKGEKPAVKLQYDTIISEQAGIDSIATTYSISTEKTTYDNAVTALTAYLVALNPAYTDFTQDTVIVGTTFNSKFKDVYDAKTAIILLVLSLNAGSTTISAADILVALLTVDGAGTGLDADLLDGKHAIYFAPIASPQFTGNVGIGMVPTHELEVAGTIVASGDIIAYHA